MAKAPYNLDGMLECGRQFVESDPILVLLQIMAERAEVHLPLRSPWV